jgi:hypothetical protein
MAFAKMDFFDIFGDLPNLYLPKILYHSTCQTGQYCKFGKCFEYVESGRFYIILQTLRSLASTPNWTVVDKK